MESKKEVVVMFGGVSPEHEVSVITGLQVMENIDTEKYNALAVYVTKQGEYLLIKGLSDKSTFLSAKRVVISVGADSKGGYFKEEVLAAAKHYPYSVYLAFHGGIGEAGPVQGLLEAVGIPYTSPSQEASVITMNKQLTKVVVRDVGIDVVPGVSVLASDMHNNAEKIAKKVSSELKLPVIVKPVHLGSSIGIKVAKTEVELEKALIEASYVDKEIVVEKFLSGFSEYNCAVRQIDGKLECSEIERPLARDEILSFADKYQRGGKKTGNTGGMASLSREVPAKISDQLKNQIQETAMKAFEACRCKGMVRIDFMYIPEGKGKLYLTEINPIPGSMAYYLWEAAGISFKTQITALIEQAVKDSNEVKSKRLDYQTDIIEKFVAQ